MHVGTAIFADHGNGASYDSQIRHMLYSCGFLCNIDASILEINFVSVLAYISLYA